MRNLVERDGIQGPRLHVSDLLKIRHGSPVASHYTTLYMQSSLHQDDRNRSRTTAGNVDKGGGGSGKGCIRPCNMRAIVTQKHVVLLPFSKALLSGGAIF